ncbi:MAG: oxygen-independent coproporphyrinogen III oxidase-like protein [Gammaproteobacteria bacterium]|nr:oxygen-independent coproporphyrinogen III oxidase-like protein [Gammaproteobacteria bacterium]
MIANQAIPLALYIHIPWCVRKCPYCDFNSHQAASDGIPERDYFEALLKDLEQLLPRVWGRRISSIFFGGGTPSLLSPDVVHELLSGIRARISCLPTAEITLEANPGSLEVEKFQQFCEAGITRLSVGVQSFSDQSLQSLGRVHDAEQAHRAIDAVRAINFNSYNIDLMFGLPGQNLSAAARDLEAALSYQPPHLSLYQLTIEANTQFKYSPPTGLPDEDTLADMQDLLADQAAAAGLERYEVSAYAARGQQCRHNVNYWEFGDYLGIGAGAHSKITDQTGVFRSSRPRLPKQYIVTAGSNEAFVNEYKLDQRGLVVEFMINALRLQQGFSLQQFSLTTGLECDVISEGISQAIKKGLLIQQGNRVRPTEKGFGFLSDIQLMFV